ncbi:MAG: DeoR family transcriptional regulator [Candidatus Campbellbacteria bacterium]|nr:DeoR family transcriptional regulator [Candidatus Campbellbacteria bacterium]
MFHQKDNKKDISTEVFPVVPKNGIHDEISSYSQKIVTAIYLVTGLMDTQDPLRNRLRLKALDIMSFISSYSNLNDKKTNVSSLDVMGATKEAVSLIEVGSSSGVISPMNGDILIRELRSLIVAFDTYAKISDIHSSSLESLFSGGLTIKPLPAMYKGHVVNQGYQEKHVKNVFKKKQHSIKGESGVNERRDKILSVVREKGNVMIKDISKHIPNCSEKTIQRDLIDLVSQGLLEKRGERRWTTYFVHEA